MIPSVYQLPQPGEITVTDRERAYLDFITETQLLDTALWHRFVRVFQTGADAADRGWRGEYWGKMMRGACLVYRCTADPRLYDVLRQTVCDLLSTADADGRISTYPWERECCGWDLWCRKYVLTGMLHFCDICTDSALTERILDSMERHLDCLIARVGPNAGQIKITATSDFWLGVNSCSILEPVMDLYRRRPQERFLRFARYIIGTGGCSDGDLIALALENKTLPCQYPETKAYETMSFFEGVLAFYEATGEQKYLDAVLRFAEAVFETEITLIGCAGCTHEQFDHAAIRQTEPSEKVMQETCVTVTWMRLCARLFLRTGNEIYADRVEQSALNALYGSVNLFAQPFTMPKSGETVPALPFDSYSPLVMHRRGRDVGGLKAFDDGSFYGCCAAIGAAGLAVYPLIRPLRKEPATAPTLCEHRLNGCVAFTFGPFVLARDAAKESGDLAAPVCPLRQGETLCYTLLPCENGEFVRLRLETERGPVLLTDYASCGKHWAENDGPITVWMPTQRPL
ncbi:MAG: glycoside hydrolase family 127 protein [Clostridia bacterium]|nr:glycoside hydrolase family 127 protein [Clostridia bacterium]